MEISKAMTAHRHILILAGLLLSACSEETVAPPAKPPTGTLQAVAVADAGPDTVTTLERALPAARKRYAHRLANSSGTNFQNEARPDIQNKSSGDDAEIA